MDKKLDKYINRKDRRYWHYYHLLQDKDFIALAKELDKRLYIQHEDGNWYHPTEMEYFEFQYIRATRINKYLDLNPDAPLMDRLIKDFVTAWRIGSESVLLNYLIKGQMPPQRDGNITLAYDETFKSFQAHIPFNVERSDMDLLWEKIKNERDRLGIKPLRKKDILTEHNTEIAYCMWKMLASGKTWTEVVKVIDEKFNKTYTNDIKTAQNFLKTHGFYV